jgi:hypothetical protein
VAGLKAEIGEQQEQRGQLREMLEVERKKLSALSTQNPPSERRWSCQRCSLHKRKQGGNLIRLKKQIRSIEDEGHVNSYARH